MIVDVKVCMGTECSMMGNLNLYEYLEELQEDQPGKINLESVVCLKSCKEEPKIAPVVSINGKIRSSRRIDQVISEIIQLIEKDEVENSNEVNKA